MEVIYLGNQTPETIAKTAGDEDADVVGISSLSGNHMILAPQVVELLREKGMDRTPVVLGGTVPPQDRPALEKAGVAGVFGPGSSLKEIVDFIRACSDRNASDQ
jgi:methylmalonyl-CoA mutase C-terminal domain/subunit